jgi:hypothetical protein
MPPNVGYGPRGPSMWDAVMAGMLLNTITSAAGNAGWFTQHRQDPGYADWRAQQDAKAQSDPALAEKLRELDQRMAQVERNNGAAGQGTAEGGTVQGVPQPPSAEGGGVVWLILFGLLAGFTLLWMARRRSAQATASTGSVTGVPQAGPHPFRRGMVLPIDPSPFLLGRDVIGLDPPDAATTTVVAVAQLRQGDLALWRLYLAEDAIFLQLHLDRSGTPDECRWFDRLDELTPGSPDEWAFWLDQGNGAIGWPVFQTKDGQEYARVWSPGQSWVPPLRLTERIDGPDGLAERQVTCMLYAKPTGVPEPGPQMKYLLVAAVEQGHQAWVALHVGIDINPVSLNLPIATMQHTGAFG